MGCTNSTRNWRHAVFNRDAGRSLGDDFHSNLAKLKTATQFVTEYNWEERIELGSGITGAVYQVTRTKTGSNYACKSLNLERFDKAQRSELWNEIQILRQLDHPNIVRLCGSYSGRDNVYLVMTMCTGGPLTKRLPVGENRIREIVRQLCSAILYCHMKGICHRDLKLDNVMYEDDSSESKVMLIDFGLSKRFKDDQVKNRPPSPRKSKANPLTTEIGNPYYMAPETTTGTYTEACDMWSLGVLAFFLITHELPFDHENGAEEVYRLAREGQVEYLPAIWSHFHPNARRFVEALLEVDVRRRWASASALQHPWFKPSRPQAAVDSEGALERIAEGSEDGSMLHETEALSQSDPGMHAEKEANLASIVSSLHEFGSFRPLKRAAYLVVAHMLPSNEGPVGKLRECFVAFDEDQTGLLSQSEFEAILRSTIPDSKETLDSGALFDRLDLDRSGKIRYLEFLAATVHSCCELTDEMIADVFGHLDEDNSNFITTRNMRRLLGGAYSSSQVKAMIDEADYVGDGRISYEEFITLMKNPCTPPTETENKLTIV